MNQAERRVWLIKALLDERPDGRSIAVPAGASEQRDLLRALMNVRPPEALAAETLDIQDTYLQQRLLERGERPMPARSPTAIALPSGAATLRCLRSTPSSMPPTVRCSAALCRGIAASTMPSPPTPACSCVWRAPISWTSRGTRNQQHASRLRRRSIYPAATFSTPSALSCPVISLALARNCCYGAATPAAWKRRRAEDSARLHSAASRRVCLVIRKMPPRAWPSIPFVII